MLYVFVLARPKNIKKKRHIRRSDGKVLVSHRLTPKSGPRHNLSLMDLNLHAEVVSMKINFDSDTNKVLSKVQ